MLNVWLAVISSAAAAIHVAAALGHFGHGLHAVVFFFALALFQVLWATRVFGSPSPTTYLTGAGVSAVVIFLWALSRTVGLPVGGEGGAEPVGVRDALVTCYEGLVGAGAVVAFASRRSERPIDVPRPRALLAPALVIAPLTITVLLVGVAPAHHNHAVPVSPALGHHLAHLVLVAGAAIGFGFAVSGEVRRSGWPGFTWRLRYPDVVDAASRLARDGSCTTVETPAPRTLSG